MHDDSTMEKKRLHSDVFARKRGQVEEAGLVGQAEEAERQAEETGDVRCMDRHEMEDSQ